MESEQALRVYASNLIARTHQFIDKDYTAPLYFNKSGFLTLFYKELNLIFKNGLLSSNFNDDVENLYKKWKYLENDGWSLNKGELKNNLSELLKKKIAEKSYGIFTQKFNSDSLLRLRTGCKELENNLIYQLRTNRSLTGYSGESLENFTKWLILQNDFYKFAYLKRSDKLRDYSAWLKWKLEQKDYRASDPVYFAIYSTKLSEINVPCIELELEELILNCLLEFNKKDVKKYQFPPDNATLMRKGLYGYG